jgi:hypothetical protein
MTNRRGTVFRPSVRAGLVAATLLVSLVLGAAPASAQNTPFDLQSFYRLDLRALAMGNAFSAVARGENALIYNPAGLVQYKFAIKGEGSLILDGEPEFLKDTYDVFTGSPSNQEIQDYLTKYDGTPTKYYRAETFVNAVANLAVFNIGMGVGSLKETRYGLTFVDVPPAGFDLSDRLVYTEQTLRMKLAAFGFQIFDGQLLMGVTLKSFKFDDLASAPTAFGTILGSGSVKLNTTGPTYSGSAYDLGMIWRNSFLPALRPQWSFVANNVGGVSLTQPSAPTLEIPASYDVGFSINPTFGPMHLLVAAAYEDVSGVTKAKAPVAGTYDTRSTGQRLHLGAEMGFWETSTGNNVLNVRVGNNRGLLSYGTELNLWSVFRLVYTHYQDDYGNKNEKDPHEFQAFQLTLGIGF